MVDVAAIGPRVRRTLEAAFAPVAGAVLAAQRRSRVDQFEELGPVKGAVVFLGDALTADGLWQEWIPEVSVSNGGSTAIRSPTSPPGSVAPSMSPARSCC